jgi:hypothetical protein
MLWSEWEFEGQPGTESRFREAPTRKTDVATITRKLISAKGRAEIKAHNQDGISDGLSKLEPNSGGGRRVLITYRPVDDAGNAVDKGRPTWVEVYAIDYDTIPANKRTPVALLRADGGDWWYLGKFRSPKTIFLTVDDRSVYGAVIERYVRGMFRNKVLTPAKREMLTKVRRSSGVRGADVEWKELAEFYRELGELHEDPFYAELASELATLR